MARINRSDVIQRAVNDLAISTATEKVPNETLDKVQLTYDLNKNISTFVTSGTSAVTGVMTVQLPTVSAGADIFLTSINFSITKDATCDQATGRLSLLLNTAEPVGNSIAAAILAATVVTLNADSQNMVLSFAYPLKVKSGSTLSNTASYTVGLMSRSCCCSGFITNSN